MATDVERSRPRDGKGSQARTRLARAAVIEAARTLFLERGYAATTIEAISDLSDVPPATVYRLFSSKPGILKALLHVLIAGDDQAAAMQDRPHVRALLANPDPRNQLSGLAGIIRGIMSRAEPLYRILLSAAGSDPDAAALLAELTRQRQQGQGQIARSLARAGALRPKLRERDAADIIHALTLPEVYRLLVCDRGWSPQRYEQWLTDILISQLLPLPAAGGGRASC
ncbi:MAG TPA: helix-turn-helix domain-containing protein [Streptosporangiaceae bacterium]|nr:helix-turn-helix domain-containing protein [Streptosporangiaceae bacterium]